MLLTERSWARARERPCKYPVPTACPSALILPTFGVTSSRARGGTSDHARGERPRMPSRNWWIRRRQGGGREEDDDGEDRFSLPTRDDVQPIDTEEQEEMVRSFERKHAHQSLIWRRIFAGFLVGYAAFLIYSIFHQAWFPWELRYHAYFMDEMPTWMVIFADWVAVLACLFTVKGLLHGSSSYKQWMWYSCYTGSFLAIFWLYYMLRLPKFRWDIMWLPFGPLSGAGICLYIDHLLMESLEDIGKLRSHMYNYKAL